MAKKEWRSVRVRAMTSKENKAVAACDRLGANVLKLCPQPEIRTTDFNYPVDLTGRMRCSRHSFVVRFRSRFPDNAGEEIDAPFARFDHDEETLDDLRFHGIWFRHVGRWQHLHSFVTLPEALELLEGDSVLRPPI